MSDPYVGKLTFFRVYSGTLDAGTYVQNTVKNQRERVGRILQMHANSREEISTIHCGEIAAAVGLRNTGTGDTLCDPDHPVILESMEFPEPVISVAIEPKTKADQDRMGTALARLGSCKPFKGFGAHPKNIGKVFSSFYFRVKKVNKDCCATLELLLDPSDLVSTSDHKKKAKNPKDPMDQKTKNLRRTGICITVDLHCFCHVTCLPAISALS